jgi:hypothetical protein
MQSMLCTTCNENLSHQQGIGLATFKRAVSTSVMNREVERRENERVPVCGLCKDANTKRTKHSV